MQSIYADVSQEFEEIRSRNRIAHEKREREIREKIPEFDDIEKEISSMGISLLKAAVNSDAQAAADKFKIRIDTLNVRKKEILNEYGYPPDYLNEIYECPICKDSGIDGTKKCICYTKRLINAVYRYSNLKDRLEKENFNTFNINYYSRQPKDGQKSPYERMEIMLRFARDYTAGFPNGQSIFMMGNVGTGKTFMCNCIAKELIDKGNTVLYLSAFQLYQLIDYDTFKRDKNEPSNPVLDLITQVDLLIIDDLGTETANVVFDSALFNYINLRESFGRSTVISTNFSLRVIKERYSERIVSRIIGNFKIMSFYGDDIRLNIKKNMGK